MQISNTLYVINRDDWRAWLAQHHATEREVWLIFYKAGSGQPRIPYDDAVEEALCFGWIDSIIQRIDDEKYAQKFTPRVNHNKWSDSNKRRVAKLIAEGRMTPVGLAKVTYPHPETYTPDEEAAQAARAAVEAFPPDLEAILQAEPDAWANYRRLAPSRRRQYVGWVMSARRAETRLRRLQEAIERLRDGEPLGMK
jgi:uncharacterized protein YdeI (YjbR/CyaY-like superfamily)